MVTIACLVTLVLRTASAIMVNDVAALNTLWNVKALFSNFLLLFRGWPFFSMMGFNNPTWYLCILIQCYFLFYTIQWFSAKTHIMPLFCYGTLIVLSIILFKNSKMPYENYRGYECFFLGTVLRNIFELLNQRHIAGKKNLFLIIIGASLYFIGLFIAFFYILHVTQRRAAVFFAFPLAIIIAWALKDSFKSTIVRKWGKISFEAFVWHVPLMIAFQVILSLTHSTIIHSYFSMIVFTVVIYVLAYILYRYVELPINKRVTKWERNRDGKTVISASE